MHTNIMLLSQFLMQTKLTEESFQTKFFNSVNMLFSKISFIEGKMMQEMNVSLLIFFFYHI